MTIEKAHEILSNGLVNAPSEHEWCVAFRTALDTMRDYQKLQRSLDKIRAEIIGLTNGDTPERIWNVDVLKIIDKYRVESEDKE